MLQTCFLHLSCTKPSRITYQSFNPLPNQQTSRGQQWWWWQKIVLWYSWPMKDIFSLISSWEHCQRCSPSRISKMLEVGFESEQNQNSVFVEWSCAVVITTTPRCQDTDIPCRSTWTYATSKYTTLMYTSGTSHEGPLRGKIQILIIYWWNCI